MYMKQLIDNKNQPEPHLKVIRNSKNKIKNAVKRIYINTLTPEFNYTNHLGETIKPTQSGALL